MTINAWLSDATTKLQQSGSPSAMLDVELILAHSLGKDRTWLQAHYDDILPHRQLTSANQGLQRRIRHTPIAYIIGYKEFYGREFTVTPDVLIPRPETERLIEFALRHHDQASQILDTGTGSGAIAITLALELPTAHVTASDLSSTALKVAARNARNLNSSIDFVQSDLLDAITGQFDLIVANLPYVDPTWQVSLETSAEPELALFADDRGLALIKKLIIQATKYLPASGTLLLEMDTRQLTEAATFAESHGYTVSATEPFLLALKKIA